MTDTPEKLNDSKLGSSAKLRLATLRKMDERLANLVEVLGSVARPVPPKDRASSDSQDGDSVFARPG